MTNKSTEKRVKETEKEMKRLMKLFHNNRINSMNELH